jgi:hypothetical protein
VNLENTEDELQRPVYTLNSAAIKYNLKISVNKTKAIAVKGKMDMCIEIVVDSNIFEQVINFNY